MSSSKRCKWEQRTLNAYSLPTKRLCHYACRPDPADKPHADTPMNPIRSRADMPAIYRPNDHADTPAIYRPNDHADTPAIYRPNDRANTPAIYRPNDRACTPTINRPTNRQALCLTTITTAAGTVLPPKQTFAASTSS